MVTTQRSDAPGSQRLFILGAGFSKPAGLPLASELLDLVLNELKRLGGRTHLHRAVDSYLGYVEATTGRKPARIDIEEFAGYLDYRHSFGVLGSDTWSEEGNRDQFLLRWGIGRVLTRATPTVIALLGSISTSFAVFARATWSSPSTTTCCSERSRFSRGSVSALSQSLFGGSPWICHDRLGFRGRGTVGAQATWLRGLGETRAPDDRQLMHMERLQGATGADFTRKRDLMFGAMSNRVSKTRPQPKDHAPKRTRCANSK